MKLTFIAVRPTEVKLSGNFYNLPIETRDSMLTLAREKVKENPRRDLVRLKEQRAEKRRKGELVIKEQLEKASQEHVETMFMHEIHV